jgi:hypothetical protein
MQQTYTSDLATLPIATGTQDDATDISWFAVMLKLAMCVLWDNIQFNAQAGRHGY